jgi:hypothetical protein
MAVLVEKNLQIQASKGISANIRKQVFANVQCCQYKDPISGNTCQSKWFLQIDHKQALWAGGTHSPENLQILCGAHNRMKYLKEKNTKFIS